MYRRAGLTRGAGPTSIGDAVALALSLRILKACLLARKANEDSLSEGCVASEFKCMFAIWLVQLAQICSVKWLCVCLTPYLGPLVQSTGFTGLACVLPLVAALRLRLTTCVEALLTRQGRFMLVVCSTWCAWLHHCLTLLKKGSVPDTHISPWGSACLPCFYSSGMKLLRCLWS